MKKKQDFGFFEKDERRKTTKKLYDFFQEDFFKETWKIAAPSPQYVEFDRRHKPSLQRERGPGNESQRVLRNTRLNARERAYKVF